MALTEGKGAWWHREDARPAEPGRPYAGGRQAIGKDAEASAGQRRTVDPRPPGHGRQPGGGRPRDYPAVVLEMREFQAAAGPLGLEVATLEIRRGEDIAPAFEALKGRADALYLVTDPLVSSHRIRINTLALDARLPTASGLRDYVEDGGLMSYGANLPGVFRRAADFVDKILRGAKPADIPVEQPTKFDLVVNLTTAKALGLTVSSPVLARADELIE